MAEKWKSNPLFRLFAFLDVCGLQSFDASTDLVREKDSWSGKGNRGWFRREFLVDRTCEARRVLLCGMVALCRNVCALVGDRDERTAMLTAIAGEECAKRIIKEDSILTRCVSGAPQSETELEVPQEELGSYDKMNAKVDLYSLFDYPFAFPEFTQAVLYPQSLVSFSNVFDDDLPFATVMRLEAAFQHAHATHTPRDTGVTTTGKERNDDCCPPLAEQFLIDAMDEWMRTRSERDNDKLLITCGVLPSIIQKARCNENPTSNEKDSGESTLETCDPIVDFVIDIVFPPNNVDVDHDEDSEDELSEGHELGEQTIPNDDSRQQRQVQNSPHRQGCVDWLIASYEKSREAVNVDDESSDASELDELEEKDVLHETVAKNGLRKRSRPRMAGNHETAEKANNSDTDDGSILLTEENLLTYFREKPSVIPKSILREIRKPLDSAEITSYELANHYTVAEIKEFLLLSCDTEDVKRVKSMRKRELVQMILDRKPTQSEETPTSVE